MSAELYEHLGVALDASPQQIKAAGKRMAKKHHPDAGGDAEAFDRARKALSVLSDPARREHYDRTGEVNLSSDPEADEEREAAQLLMQGMIGVLQDTGLRAEHTDITARVRQHIEAQIRTLGNNRIEHEAAQKRNEQFLNRLRVKAGAPDPIGDFLRDQLSHLVRGLAEIDRRLRIAERAKVMSAAYSYKVDGPDMQRAWAEAAAGLGGQAPRTGSPFLDMLNGGL